MAACGLGMQIHEKPAEPVFMGMCRLHALRESSDRRSRSLRGWGLEILARRCGHRGRRREVSMALFFREIGGVEGWKKETRNTRSMGLKKIEKNFRRDRLSRSVDCSAGWCRRCRANARRGDSSDGRSPSFRGIFGPTEPAPPRSVRGLFDGVVSAL